MSMQSSSSQRRRRGLTLLDSMFLTAIIGVLAVGVGRSITALAKVSEGNDEQRAISETVSSEIERLRNDTFADLTSQLNGNNSVTITQSIPITVGSVTNNYSETIVISKIDPTNPPTGTSYQSDFLSVQVTIGQCTSAVWMTAI